MNFTLGHKIAAGALVGASLFAGGLALGDEPQAAPVPQPTPTQSAPVVPAPEETAAPALTRAPDEKRYLDSIRAWTSPAMSPELWSDVDLLNYGKAVCAALPASNSPEQYQAHMATLRPLTGQQTPADDIEYAEVYAVRTWCMDQLGQHRMMRP